MPRLKRRWFTAILINTAFFIIFVFAIKTLLPFIFSSGDFSVKIARDYYIHRVNAGEIFIAPLTWNDQTLIIPSIVTECNFDQRYIIGKRKRKELHPSSYEYWILNTRLPQVFGPLSLDEFTLKRNELGISMSLKLKDVYDFRP